MEFQVSLHQVGQTGVLAMEPPLDGGPGDKDLRRGAVVGSRLPFSPSHAGEFRERGQHHAFIQTVTIQVLEKSTDR